jgi:hypothetical protein
MVDCEVANKCVQTTKRLAHATATRDGAPYARAAQLSAFWPWVWRSGMRR